MPSAKATALCQSTETLTGAVAAAPTNSIGGMAKSLYSKTGTMKRLANSVNSRPIARDPQPSKEDLDIAEKCGKFPHRPSDLFLKIYHDCLKCVDREAFSGCCSPPLLGTSGVIPISIISIIPDIMRHYASVILSAEHEIFIATNFLQKSRSLTIITDALRQLSTRVREKNGKKIIVKFMYDRGTAEQLVRNHAPVKPADWPAVGLPASSDIPGLDMEVINYHRPLLGTFHCKFMVVDRRIALISSNNIQDRANLEMMVHTEGDIVQSFYDMALWCWANAMKPALPLVNLPPPHVPEFLFGTDSPFLKGIDLEEIATVAREDLRRQHTEIIPQLEAAENRNPLRRATQSGDSVEDLSALNGELPAAKTPLIERLGTGRFAETVRNVLDRGRDAAGAPKTTPLTVHATDSEVNAASVILPSGKVPQVDSAEVKRLEQEAVTMAQEEHERANQDSAEKPNPWREVDDKLAETREEREKADRDIQQQSYKPANSETKKEKDNPQTQPPVIVAAGSALPTPKPQQDAQPFGRDSPAPVPSPPVASEPDTELLTAPLSPTAATHEHHEHHPEMPNGDATTNGHANGHARKDSSDTRSSSSLSQNEARDRIGYAPSENQSSFVAGHHRRSSSIGGRSFRSRHSLHSSVAALTDHLNTGGGEKADAGVEANYDIANFSPFVVHSEHSPVPIALVNRPAHGMPGHEDILTPQNVSWLAAFKYAQRKVFIQSPTLNAAPIVAAIIDACKRGIDVHLWLNLGFNDQGEMIPFQGGTNEEVVTRLYKALNPLDRSKYLHVFWYVGKDQRIPLNAAVKKRNCHIKFMAVDDEVGIVGNGNQDTQSWFHSQEANIMVDSPQIVREWIETLRANQNTEMYGRVGRDGVWRYADGRPLEHLNLFKGVGPFGRILGLVGAFNRATGSGTSKKS